MPLYEHVFLARQDASTQQVEELTTQMTGIVEQLGGKVVKMENWGVRSLTYRMNKNRKAHFVLLNIDGPSAGLAIFLALYSAVTKTPIPQDVAITGELSIQGKVRGVGGIVEKLYAARQAGMRQVLVPKENAREIDAALSGLEVVPVTSVAQVLRDLPERRR